MDRRHFRVPDQLTDPRSSFGNQRVVLDSYTCDLNLTVDQSGYVGTPLTKDGFAYIWGGARATHGFKDGQVCFSVKILENLDVLHLPAEERNPHVVRVGFSCKYSTLKLGEEPLSCGYGGTGKACLNGKYFKYGTKFSTGDIITAFLDFQRTHAVVTFAVNAVHQGVAHRILKNDLNGRGLFPHVLSRNCRFQVNFGQLKCVVPRGFEDFRFPDDVPIQQREKGFSPPRRTEDCQFIMMVGLPASGKSTWVQEYSKRKPENNYNILGTDTIMANMKVLGLQETYNARFQALYKLAENCLDHLLHVASTRKRNYILDQTNVYASARERKISAFMNFYRVAVVLVPSDEHHTKRLFYQRESGKYVPEKAILNMKANFSIPTQDQFFDDVIYAGMQFRKATDLVLAYNNQGRRATGQQLPKEKHKSRVTTSVESDITSRMAELSVAGTYPAPCGVQRSCRGQGRSSRGPRRGGTTRMQEPEDSPNQTNRSGYQGRYYGKQSNRGRGPTKAVSTSALYTGQGYVW